MSWRQSTICLLSDGLRFAAWGCLLIDGILISAFSVWFVARFLWQVIKFFNRAWFGHEW